MPGLDRQQSCLLDKYSDRANTQLATVNRRNKDGTREQITCPQSVKEYNKNMGGVDLADAKKIQKVVALSFYFLVNISMVNAYLLHQNNTHSPRMKMKDFILELATELLTAYSS